LFFEILTSKERGSFVLNSQELRPVVEADLFIILLVGLGLADRLPVAK